MRIRPHGAAIRLWCGAGPTHNPERRTEMRVLLPSLLTILLLCSCSKTSGGGQHATVELRDGTSVTGTVMSSSPTELQIAGDDKLTRTIAMSQVRSIEYDENPAAAPGAPPEAATAPAA